MKDMEGDLNLFETTERYIKGQLSRSEQEVFELRIEQDAQFAKSVNEYIEFLEALNHFAGNEQTKVELNKIHTGMLGETERVVPVRNMHNQKQLLNSITYRMMGVAAAVAIFAVTATIITMNFYQSSRKNSGYVEMKKYVDNRINNSEKKMISKMVDPATGKKPAVKGIYSGTGFLITTDGYLMTSYHVVKEAVNLQVVNDGFAYDAQVINADPVSDYALIKINDSSFEHLSTIPFRMVERKAEMGQKVYTLGYPRNDLVYGEGSISSLTGFADDTIAYQISVPLNPGNSGGPLFDDSGNLIGLISGKQSKSEAAAFAIKSGYLLQSLNQVNDPDFKESFKPNGKSKLSGMGRVQQIKTLKSYVFEVRVLN